MALKKLKIILSIYLALASGSTMAKPIKILHYNIKELDTFKFTSSNEQIKAVREIINEDSLGDKFQKTIQRYQDKVRKEKEAYRKAKELQKKRKKITKEQNFEKVTMPSNVKRFMKRFIDAVQSGKLNRQRQKAILYKVIKGLGISPQELMMYVQKVKKGL